MRWVASQLVLTWTIANTLGGLAGFAAGGAVTMAGLSLLGLVPPEGSRSWAEVLLVLACASTWPAVAGGVVGLAQWLVLRAHLSGVEAVSWIRLNALLWLAGTVAAGIGGYLVELTVGNRSWEFLSTLVAGLLLAATVAIGQWLTLNRQRDEAWIWGPAVVVGYTAGAVLGAAAAGLTLRDFPARNWFVTLVVAPAAAGAVGGCVSGLVTGLALVRLVRAAVRPDGDRSD